MAIFVSIYSIEGPDVGFMKGAAYICIYVWRYAHIHMFIAFRAYIITGSRVNSQVDGRNITAEGTWSWGFEALKNWELSGCSIYGYIVTKIAS